MNFNFRCKPSVYSRLFNLMLTATLLALNVPANASVTLCATTAKELYDDLAAASDNGMYAGQDVYIAIPAGTYKTGSVTGNGPFLYMSTAATGVISLTGGYGPDCGGSVTPDARLTMLDGAGLTQVLNIQNKTAEVDVSFLTIQNGKSAVAGGGVAINTGVTGGIVYLDDDIIRNNHTASIGGGFAIDGAGNHVSASGDLVTGNSADGDYGGGFLYSRSGLQADVYSSTFANNTTTNSGGTGGLYCCGDTAVAIIEASIFWNNTNFGVDLATPEYSLEYSDYNKATGLLNTSVTNFHVDPKFVDAANGNFRLDGNSPLLGVWPAQGFPSTDLVGDHYPYPVQGYYDVGAYEDTIFTDQGFESK
jgi:hypothetical protein